MTVTDQIKPHVSAPQKSVATRKQIVQAALALFLKHGFAGTTMAAIARDSGLAKGTAYHYFQNKEELFAGIIDSVIVESLMCPGQQALREDEHIADFYRRTLLPFIQPMPTTPRAAIIRLVLTEGNAFPSIKEIYTRLVYTPLTNTISKAAKDAVARGEHRATPLVDYPQLLLGPIWMGAVGNDILAVTPGIDRVALFEAQLRLLFK